MLIHFDFFFFNEVYTGAQFVEWGWVYIGSPILSTSYWHDIKIYKINVIKIFYLPKRRKMNGR